ncbi:MAG: polysaccharide deacetylase family protein, partial [Chitinophagaceae bacterium]|nr:polysaccharide deacetylase family protein [Chitinophagaceae bacterium]
MFYLVRPPLLLRKLYPGGIWSIRTKKKEIYFTFDDGPNAISTAYILDALKKYDAKATFFCIGKNVVEHIELYKRIIDDGHAVGNHTYDHLNG